MALPVDSTKEEICQCNKKLSSYVVSISLMTKFEKDREQANFTNAEFLKNTLQKDSNISKRQYTKIKGSSFLRNAQLT